MKAHHRLGFSLGIDVVCLTAIAIIVGTLAAAVLGQ